jgi:hypothetical protein
MAGIYYMDGQAGFMLKFSLRSLRHRWPPASSVATRGAPWTSSAHQYTDCSARQYTPAGEVQCTAVADTRWHAAASTDCKQAQNSILELQYACSLQHVQIFKVDG